MLDITHKFPTLRTATAEATVKAAPETVQRVAQRRIPKGDALETARAAAVMAAKNTPGFIPFCHPINLTYVGVDYSLNETTVSVRVTVKAIAATGVEMEALTGAAAAALTLYDMLKALDDNLEVIQIKLLEKRGGKSDFREESVQGIRGGVLVMSDSIASGKKTDASGVMIRERMTREGVQVVEYRVVPDEEELIAEILKDWADCLGLDLVLTTGGTGFSPRDRTPEAMARIMDRTIPGIPEALRAYGQLRTPYAMLSRAVAGLRGNTLIINLPGSRKGVAESLDALFPALLHAFPMIRGEGWGTGHRSEA